MPFQATCPNCLKILEVPESLLGKQVRCASCQQIFLIGQPRGSSGAEAAPKNVRTMTSDGGPQIQRAPRPAVILRPAEELPPPSRHPRRIRRNKIPVAVWIAAGCAAGVFGVVVLAAVGFLIYRLSASKTPDSKPPAALQAAFRQEPALQPARDPQPEAPRQQPQPQPPNPQPPNGPPGGMAPWQGPPPGNRPPERNQGWQVVLSDGRVGPAFGLQRSFTINYRFEQGDPAPGQFYFLVIKSRNTTAQAQIQSLRMAKQGTFHLRELGIGTRDNGPFDAHLETGLPGPFGARQVISNTIRLSG